MREIKFRAWFENEVATQMLIDKTPGDCLRWLAEGQDIKSVMQYTGLKDKNGVEIYEGDIIRIETYNNRYYVNKIVFEQGTFHFGYLPDGMCDYKEMEVIGNIYENLELLDTKKDS